METDKLKALSDLAQTLEKATQFNMLKPYHGRKGMHTAKLYFHGYNDLTLTVMDIIKVCVAALYGLEENDHDKKYASAFTIAEVLGLALELMPMEESEIIDECYNLHLKFKEKEAEESPTPEV